METIPRVTVVLDPPTREDSANFDTRADQLMTDLPVMTGQENAMSDSMNILSGEIEAAVVTTSENVALTEAEVVKARTEVANAEGEVVKAKQEVVYANQAAAAAASSANAIIWSDGGDIRPFTDGETLIYTDGLSYRCLADTLAGESPDTHPAKWKNILTSLESGVNIKTINSESIVGSGNLTILGGLQSQQIFSLSGAWTKPEGVIKVRVSVAGGGGGGGANAVGNESTSGGGGGGTAIKIVDVSEISEVIVTVGAGGGGSENGGTSSFGTHCSGIGGGGGVYTVGVDSGGLGGTGVGGDVNISGQDGESSYHGTAWEIPRTCGGGNSFYGSGGKASVVGLSIQPSGFGSGGQGEVDGATTPYGPGKQGIVIVEEYA